MAGVIGLTKFLVATLEPVGLHLAVEVLLGLHFLFKLLVVSILELRPIEFLVPFDVLSQS